MGKSKIIAFLTAFVCTAAFSVPVRQNAFAEQEIKGYMGDLNADMQSDELDLTIFGRYLSGEENFSKDDIRAVDFNNNGIADEEDYQLMQERTAAGISPEPIYGEVSENTGSSGTDVGFVIPMNESDIIYSMGDIDNSGIINSSDASMILEEYSFVSTIGVSVLTESQKIAADVNSDGFINSSDASTVLSYYSYTSTGGTVGFEEYLKEPPARKPDTETTTAATETAATSTETTTTTTETTIVTETTAVTSENVVEEPIETEPVYEPVYTEVHIYRTKTGKKYHYDDNCGNGTYYECTLEEALAAGLTPCSKCVH
ncbi:MAG: hypothetical protein IJ666_07310 [Ruminococcus sp.]|nr:hypothetical protein [Ruminococcus sp.]